MRENRTSGCASRWSCPGFVDTPWLGRKGASTMPKSHRPYPPAFRRQMIELVRRGRSPEELGREFEPSAQAIRNWVKQAALDAGQRTDGLTTEERDGVARLMRALGVCGISRRKRPRTTLRDQAHRPAPDLVARDFAAAGPDRLWVADITYIPTWAGFLYLAVVVDAWSRRVIGWAMESHLRTELVLAALDMAVEQRRPTDVIHHSDQGCQYTSIAFGLRCREAGVRPSMGSVGDAYGNALCESFFATLECELLDRQRFPTQADARLAIFDFIEGWYNPRRRHSALDYLSPMIYERTCGLDDRTVLSGSTIDQGGAISVSPTGAVQ